jgi:hypothetical protein
MDFLHEASSEPGSPPSAEISRGNGKGLAWSDIENLALCDGHQQVSEPAGIGWHAESRVPSKAARPPALDQP